jgi:hypothetical protein
MNIIKTITIAVGCTSVAALTMMAAFMTGEAYPHEADSGWRYPTRCCWSPQTAPAGRMGDCDEIPNEAVKVGPAGYVVTLEPGDHPMVKQRLTFTFPYDKTEAAPDGRYHVCFDSMMKPRCFFAGARMG